MPVNRRTVYEFSQSDGSLKCKLEDNAVSVDFNESEDERVGYQYVKLSISNIDKVITILTELKRAKLEDDLQ